MPRHGIGFAYANRWPAGSFESLYFYRSSSQDGLKASSKAQFCQVADHKTPYIMSSAEVASVATYTDIVQELLYKGKQYKPTGSIDPILRADDLGPRLADIGSLSQGAGSKGYAAIETACRNIFYNLLVGTEHKL